MLSQKTNRVPDMKVILVGDTSVGKTSLVAQYNSATFDPTVESTIGGLFVEKQVKTSTSKVNLRIWDTAGQECYRSLIPMYSRDAAAALIVVDVSSESSYISVGNWYKMLKDTCPPDVRIYVVANKIDLPVKIPLDELEEWTASHCCGYFQSCASKISTVEPIFRRIAEDTFRQAESERKIEFTDALKEESRCC
jgi:small GTP-binding protein